MRNTIMLFAKNWVVLLAVGLTATMAPAVARAVPTKVELKADGPNFTLLRDGKPFFVQGAGGAASKQLLKDSGGNSFRTWGADDIDGQLDEAQRLGLGVTVGIWLGHEQHHFDYGNAAMVAKQYEMAKKAILKYKDHPAVLMWAIGNEMEGYKEGDNALIWAAVENIARFAHRNDPNHPTMTVIAEIGGARVSSINEFCPDIDVIGINSYGGGPSLAGRYRTAGGVKPFIITEFGPGGTWEVGKNAWGAPIELPSTVKGDSYRATYTKSVLAEKGKLCLGSYVFAWGNKQEATATWYGMFLADGTRLEALDVMHELWSGTKVANRCPQVKPLVVTGEAKVQPGASVHVNLEASDPEGDPLTVKWTLSKDYMKYDTGGDVQEVPPSYPQAVIKGDTSGVDLKMPDDGGGYWLYAYVYDGKGGAAMADTPLFVDGPKAKPKAKTATLPLIVFGDEQQEVPYIGSGWMGNMQAINIDEKCTTNPHTGMVCMKVDYKSPTGFGGVVWQSPANDWGELPGGFNLTGAKKLTLWARGEEGDEQVDFKFGVIGKDKKFPDSASGATHATLTKEWKQYQIDLSGKDLSCIKTGFVWALGGKGKAVTTFYLDDIRYE